MSRRVVDREHWQSGIRLAVKRAADVAVSAAALIAASPVLLGAAVAVRLSMGGPVLFVQPRPGRGGRTFRLYKLRTMASRAGADGQPLPDEQRLTRLGAFLRSASIDELPQLVNVLRGDMSLVGPRPLLVEYLPMYSAEQARRHDVLPGITGWTQVNGRNDLSWEKKFELDVWYVDHWSLTLDARILLRTLWRVFRRDGISRAGHATSPRFMGSGAAGGGRG